MACHDRIDPSARHNDRNRLGRILGRPDHRVPASGYDDINLERAARPQAQGPDRVSLSQIGTRW